MEACHLRSASRVLALMQDLGGIYIKLGQHLSTMHYLLPDAWTSTLAVLQDQCATVSTRASLEQLFWDETSQTIADVFQEVDWTHPLGVASLAQVHQGMLRSTGEKVAVKWQHPSIETYCRLDLQCVTTLVNWMQWWFPTFGFGWLVDEMNEALPMELDFTNEAKNADRVRAEFKDDPGALVVPKVMFATPRILCMEYIDGARPDDLEYMTSHNIDPVQVSTEITTLFAKMMFLHGFVHCDPHPGNLLIRPSRSNSNNSSNSPNFDVVLLDHGQYRTLTREVRTDYAHLWTSLMRGDEHGIETYAYRLGCQQPHHRLFASLLTGREWHTIEARQLGSPPTPTETTRVAGRTDLFLHKIVTVLSSLPRAMLLLLKTSDLLRHLNTALESSSASTSQRKYGSLVQCCNKAVWLDTRQKLWERWSSLDSLGLVVVGRWCRDYLVAWWDYSFLDWAVWYAQS
ncbi:ABC1 family-domain-containing protein [Absidia repens]|uniref:ABC1 family-domain-containing protein n=1 Tax=Absidia repens TaxID=90262 RepID=A0A1X2I7Z8_9FUNG|nr:ABC1 family-domain-containing protein [Absidia repens]